MNKEKISIVIAAVLVFVTVFALSGCHNAKKQRKFLLMK